MRQPYIFIIILSVFIVIMDLYTYKGITSLIHTWSVRQKLIVNIVFWLISLVSILWVVWLGVSFNSLTYKELYRNITILFGFIILFYVPKLFFNIFQIISDISGMLAKGVALAFRSNETISESARKLSRSDFLLQLGVILSVIPFISILWGIWKGKYNFKITKLKLGFPNLPEAFNGIRLLQISDFHIGSFAQNHAMVEKVVELVNEQEADYLLFTGDLVNNIAAEVDEFVPILIKFKARHGKFSILGNHDYGEYYQWSSREELKKNMEDLYEHHRNIGFSLLRNESVLLEKEGKRLALIGVENWGLPPFPQYGDLEKAMKNVEQSDFKVLMSHDPSHWDAQVLKKTNIDLTLSGHTHGMQFALKIPGWRWSPVKWKYPRWAGLYEEDAQKLYVNIGIGFIAFPGRVGTPPEITVFELVKS